MVVFAKQPALIAFVAALALAQLLGEVPPLSRFTMYAQLPDERAVAVLQLRADGVPVEPWDYEGFSGAGLLDPPWPEGVPCTMRWYRDEVRAFVQRHRGDPAAPGPVTVSWGYVVVGWREGQVAERAPFVTLAEGRARPD